MTATLQTFTASGRRCRLLFRCEIYGSVFWNSMLALALQCFSGCNKQSKMLRLPPVASHAGANLVFATTGWKGAMLPPLPNNLG